MRSNMQLTCVKCRGYCAIDGLLKAQRLKITKLEKILKSFKK
jgi:hypothetical protein